MTHRLVLDPPLLNSACPWATTKQELQDLYRSPFTGAVTTRTATLSGFPNNPAVHNHIFFNSKGKVKAGDRSSGVECDGAIDTDVSSQNDSQSSLNTYGYSPHPLHDYCAWIRSIIHDASLTVTENVPIPSPSPVNSIRPGPKPIIVSVTGTPADICTAYQLIVAEDRAISSDRRVHNLPVLAMEVNLSCPNIGGKPPPAYDYSGLQEYLDMIKGMYQAHLTAAGPETPIPPTIGLKLPPYTYQGQFEMVVKVIQESGGTDAVGFITCTNTLGSCLVMDTEGAPALQGESGLGLGGMAGSALHALALGNVATFRRLLNASQETKGMIIIGVGGVSDSEGYQRMRAAGADAVACATALGIHGVDIFQSIARKQGSSSA